MGKKSSNQPPPPDPVALAQAQSQSNIDTAREQQRLNLINTAGPQGAVRYAADPTAPGGYSQTTTLSPEQQAIWSAQQATELGATNIAHDQLGRVQGALQTPLNTQGLPDLQGGVQRGGYAPQPAYGGQGYAPATSNRPAQPYDPTGGVRQAPGAPPPGFNPQSADPQSTMSMLGMQGQAPDLSALGGGRPMGQMPGGKTGFAGTSPLEGGDRTSVVSAQGFGGYQPQPPGGVGTSLNPQLAQHGIQAGFDPGGALVTGVNAGDPERSFATGPAVQGDVRLQRDFNPGQQVQGHVGPTDLYGAAQQAQDAVYGQAASRLDPRFTTDQAHLEQRLSNQGLSQNSEAYRNAMDEFGRSKNDAYNQAIYSSVGAGNDYANQLFGQSVQQGQFANQAAGQQYSQNLGAAQFGNDAALQAGQFHNTAQGQGFGQNLQGFQARNASQQQLYDQLQGNAGLNNAATGQRFTQNMQGAQFGNQAQNQDFNQGLASAQLSNTARQQGLQERAYQQNEPINQLTGLLSLGQVGMPNGVQYTPTQVANTDVIGANALSVQAQQAQANARQQQQSGMMSGLMSLGSAAIMASDTRLKTDKRLLRTRPDGVEVWAFRYLTDPAGVVRVGVMAQQLRKLRPELVVKRADGLLAVDYSGLEAA